MTEQQHRATATPPETHVRRPRSWRSLGYLILILGCAAITLGLAGPRLGLGSKEQFLPYVWLGLSRTFLASIGALALVVATVLVVATSGRPWRIMIGNACLALCGAVMALLPAEIVARAIDGKPVFAVRNWLAERNAVRAVPGYSSHDPLLGWAVKPDQSINANDPGTSFTTGPHGIRLNRPAAGIPAKGGILAVGDSFTLGSEVGDRDSWPAQLEAMLGRPVINAAAGAWAADQIVLRAESLLPILEPTTVIVSFYSVDVQRARYRVYQGKNKPFFTLQDGTLVHHNRPVPVYSGRFEEMPSRLGLLGYSYLVLFVTDRLEWSTWWQAGLPYVLVDNDPIAVSCALLRRLHGELRATGARLLFVLQYGPGDVKNRPPQIERVITCARVGGIEILDLWDDLVAVYRSSFEEFGRLFVSFDGRQISGHMSPRGNGFVAKRIAERIKTKPLNTE